MVSQGQLSNGEPAPRRLGHRPVLDGIRGIAILLVMLMHTRILANGYMGVDVFFALSGFLITTLLFEEWDRSGTISLRRFYARRARRLLPALFALLAFCLLVNAFVYPMTGWSLGHKALTTVLFVNNWVVALGNRVLGSLTPTWSLAQEEQFYLVWPLILLLMLRTRLKPAAIAAVLTVMIVLLVGAEPHLESSINRYDDYYSPPYRAAELLFGCLAAVVWRNRLLPSPLAWAKLPRAGRLAEAIGGRWREAVSWALVGLFVWLMLDQRRTVGTVYVLAAVITVPLMVILLEAPDSLLARLIGCRPLRALGRISYSLYLYHLLVHDVVSHYMGDGSVYLLALLTFVLSLALATASWYLMESRIIKRGVRRRKRVAVASRSRLRIASETAG